VSHGINERTWRAVEEYGSAIALLLLFAILWLTVDLARRSAHTVDGPRHVVGVASRDSKGP
jgi:hypothetical protein